MKRGNVLVTMSRPLIAQRLGGIILRCMSAHPMGLLNGHVITPTMQTDFERALTFKFDNSCVWAFANKQWGVYANTLRPRLLRKHQPNYSYHSTYVVSRKKNNMPGCQNVMVPERRDGKVPRCHIGRVPECQGAKVSRCQSARVPECHGARVSRCQSARVAVCHCPRSTSPSGCDTVSPFQKFAKEYCTDLQGCRNR